MKAVKSWLSWCVKQGLAQGSRTSPQGCRRREGSQAVGRAEVNRFLREVEREGDPRDAALIRLMLSCLRVSELSGPIK